jgi:hypothetical protein
MAAPNIVNVATITGSITNVALGDTNEASIANNAASSGAVLKINTIIVANVNTTASATITIKVHSAATLGGTGYPIVSTVSVPPNSALVVLDKASSIYLPENMSIGATASVGNYLVVTTSYEAIS